MAGRICRMSGGAFGESLRKEIIPIPIEAALHCLGVEHVVVHVALQRPAMASQNLSRNRAAGLGTVPQVNRPFLIPHAVERKASDCRERGRDIGTTERAEAVLRGGTDVGITRVPWCADRVEHQECCKVCLEEHVQMGICAKIAAIMELASLRLD